MTDANMTTEMMSSINMISIIGALLMVAVWAFAVCRENSGQVLKRGSYILMCLSAFFFLVIVGAGTIFAGLNVEMVSIINTTAQICVSYIIGGKSTLRSRDAGWPKAWVYCMVIPIVGFIIMLALWFKGTADPNTEPANQSL